MVNVGKFTIHGWYGFNQSFFSRLDLARFILGGIRSVKIKGSGGSHSGGHFQGEVSLVLVWNQQISGYQQDQCVNKAIIHGKYKTREFVGKHSKRELTPIHRLLVIICGRNDQVFQKCSNWARWKWCGKLDVMLMKTHEKKVYIYKSKPGPSKGCHLNPKGCGIDTLSTEPFR